MKILNLNSISLAGCLLAGSIACGDDGGEKPRVDGSVSADAVSVDGATPDSGTSLDGATLDAGVSTNAVVPTCAPNDGLAYQIKLAGAIDFETCTPDFEMPALILTFTPDFRFDVPATFDFGESGFNYALLCSGAVADPPCATITEGSITINEFTENGTVSGTYILSPELGKPISGSFTVEEWCGEFSGCA